MQQTFDDSVMDYLTAARTASLGNLAMHFEFSFEEFVPIIRNLESQGRLRFSMSRCQSDCSSCHSSCGDSSSSVPAITERTIVISLERKEQEL